MKGGIAGRIDRSKRRINGEDPESANQSLSLLALRLRSDLALGDQGRSIGIVAIEADEVAAEATLELAWSLADEFGHRVLVIDGAFGSGRLSAALGLDARPGLAELLNLGGGDPQAFADRLVQTPHPRVTVLAHGLGASGCGVATSAVRALFGLAVSQFDFVLAQATIQADVSRSMAFCAGLEAALLLAIEEHSTWQQIARGQRLLAEAGARKVALVLTRRRRAPALGAE